MYAKLETIEVNVKTIATGEGYTLKQIVPLNLVLVTREADGFCAVVDDATDAAFWLTVVTQKIATVSQVAKYLTFTAVD
jgi:hypothetical protein